MPTTVQPTVHATPAHRGRHLRWPVAVLATLLLAGCASASASNSQTGTPTAAETTYPVTVDNCGRTVTVTKQPQRIVTVKSSTLDLLVALGLSDKVVGATFPDAPVQDGIPVLSDKVPSQEATLKVNPDLIFAGWESNVSADGVGTRDSLAALGVTTYVAPAACKEPSYKPNPMTFDTLFAQIAEAGRVFGAQNAATELISQQRSQLAKITPDGAQRTALWYSSGSDVPYVGAGIGVPQMIMDAAGLTNIAADVKDSWSPLSWEAVADADPDVIILVDAGWNTAKHKIDLLRANPATAALSAVRSGRFITVDFPATEAGVRNVEAVDSIVAQLAGLDGKQ
ncbi:MAG: putative F420-0 ABC transporter substrate-binding protein [Nostocoides sp.]